MKGRKADEGQTSASRPPPSAAANRGASVLDLILRFLAAAGTLAGAIVMGTTPKAVAITTQSQFVRLNIKYQDLPPLTFFVIANALGCLYTMLSITVSTYHIFHTGARATRIALSITDSIMLVLLTAGASAATAAVYLAHEGSAGANWPAICQQFNSFCSRITGSLIGPFAAVIVFLVTIGTSVTVASRC